MDTADAYDMLSTWSRGVPRPGMSEVWPAKPGHMNWLVALAAETKTSLADLILYDASIHFKRGKGKCVNPLASFEDRVVFYVSKSEEVGVWYGGEFLYMLCE